MRTEVNLNNARVIDEEIVGLNIRKIEFSTSENYHILERTSINDECVWRLSHIEETELPNWEEGGFWYLIKWEVITDAEADALIEVLHPFQMSDLFDSFNDELETVAC